MTNELPDVRVLIGLIVSDVKFKNEDETVDTLEIDTVTERYPGGAIKKSTSQGDLIELLERYAGREVEITIKVIR